MAEVNDNNDSLSNIEKCNTWTFESFVGGTNKVFEIPLFQRNFSWDRESCEQLFNDIYNAWDREESYYIGNFMYYKSDDTDPKVNKFVLIDGQQRITSILLLLCAIRDLYSNLTIENDFLVNSLSGINKYRFKLKQNYNDYDDFVNILNKNIEEKNSSIYDAYHTFLELLNNKKRKISKNIEDFYATIKNLECICILLNSNDMKRVQDIFEKMNSTGVDLSSADLIRNFLLFDKNVDVQQELHEYWKRIEDVVGEKGISKFAKAFLIRFTFQDVSSDRVYTEFKKKYNGDDHKEILKKMIRYSTYYAMVEYQRFYEFENDNVLDLKEYNFNDKTNQNTAKFNSLSKLKTTFALLNKIGTDEINPFFLQLCNELYEKDKDKLDDICQLILEFVIRYRIVQPSAGGGALSTKIRTIMSAINSKKCTMTKRNIYKMLSDNSNSEASRYPSNDEFITALKGTVFIKNARVLLYQLSRRKKDELIEFNSNITVEHLMPQGIDEKDSIKDLDKKWWIDNLGGKDNWQKVYNTYLNCIGNMALVSRSLNSDLKNKPWDIKRVKISERALGKSARDVAKKEKWTKTQINNRNNSYSNEIAQYITGPSNEKKKEYNWLIK